MDEVWRARWVESNMEGNGVDANQNTVILVITTTRRRRLHTFLHAFTHKAWTEPNNLWLAFDKHVLRQPGTYIRYALDRRYSIFPFPEC